MFAEVKWFKLEENNLYFYLESNKKWHKDQLNKAGNTNLISKIVKEVTSKNYRIKFELESSKGKNDNEKIFNINGKKAEDVLVNDKESVELEVKESTKNVGTENINSERKHSSKIDAKGNGDKSANKKDEEIFDYLEKKFEIKEK